MKTSRTEPRHALFWLVTGYVITITLLVLAGALLYYFAGSSLDLPALLPGQIAFRAMIVWLVLIWFCAPFILCWQALVKRKAWEVTGVTGHQKRRLPEHQWVKDITTQLHFQYGRRWRRNVRIMLIVGEENEVEQAIPGLTTQHWLEGHGALLLWLGRPLDEPDASQLRALCKIRRRLADALVWVVNEQTICSHDILDTVTRQLQKQYHKLGWEVPLWLWETQALAWEQPGLPAQGIGFLSTPGDKADDFRHALKALEVALVQQGMQQTLNDRKHTFLLQLAQRLREGRTERLTDTLSQLAEGARSLPLGGMVFSPAIAPGAAALPHAWQPGNAWLDLLTQRWRKPVATRVSWRKSLQLACTCLLVFWLAATLFAWAANLRLMQADQQLAQHATDTQQPMPMRLMALWHLQQEMERLQYRQKYGAPWYMRMGLSRNDDLLDALWPYWQQAAMPLLRDASAQHLSSLMKTWRHLPPDDPQRSSPSKAMYDLLRAYLMLSRPEKADPAFFSTTLMQHWPQREGVPDGTWRRVGHSLLAFMLQNLPAHREWRTLPDMPLVSGMRSALLRQIGASNAESARYQQMIEQVSRDYAEMTLSAMVNGTVSSQLFTTEVTVPGVFTRKAWEEDVQPAIEKLATLRREE
ncbi:ImcF-related family protein, partial [Enterobacteriaceae bacterium LUAb1]